MTKTFSVPAEAAGQRLDLFLANISGITRSQLRPRFAANEVRVNGRPAPSSHRLQAGSQVDLTLPEIAVSTAPVVPKLPIVYQDETMVIVDKPAGLVVHGGAGVTASQVTVADFARTISSDHDTGRPGIVHRLDKDTSGLLMIARTSAAKQYLQAELAARQVHKTYIALVTGRLEPAAATINLPLGRDPRQPLQQAVAAGGRTAQTRYKVRATYPGYTLVEAWPVTGRTHQLRVHFAATGHAIAGDTTYGAKQRPPGLTRQFLHASQLQLTSPSGAAVKAESPLPADLAGYLSHLAKLV